MIKVVILEDEMPARKKLKRFLEAMEQQVEIIAEIDTVSLGVDFLKNNKADLIFSDIELLDGNAFEIYEQVTVSCPIIFTTAYNQFWMHAFESNGIDYLLKPFTKERFQKAWDKFLLLSKAANSGDQLMNSLAKLIENNLVKKQFKKRFTISNHQGIHFLDTENISYFEASEGVVFAHDSTGKKHLLNEATLKEIEEKLNPASFFRINRSELVNKSHIEKIVYYNKNALAVKLKGCEKLLTTSQNNTAQFRIWIER